MVKLHRPSIKMAKPLGIKAKTVRDSRITGTKLQKRRFNVWTKDPHCAVCRRLVSYPSGFELDHITPLYLGGKDTEENCQILCVEYTIEGKRGCHYDKTIKDLMV